MKTSLSLILTASCSCATAWLTTGLVQPQAPAPVTVTRAGNTGVEGLQEELAGLRRAIRELQLEGASQPRRVAKRAQASRGELAVATQDSDVSTFEEESDFKVRDKVDPVQVANRLEAILAADINSQEAAALWAEAHEQGLLHEVLAAMEERMQELPETPQKHFDRGRAYYSAARAFPANSDGNWWVDSDDAYSRALELNPQHWDARYQKARNMAFWPVAYGGQAEAVRHFETLVQQQQGAAPDAKFADTYWWLGNLYDQQGRSTEAQAMWKAGSALYPDHESLAKKLQAQGL